LPTIRDRSTAPHSGEAKPPPLTDQSLVQAGLRSYHSTCVICHSAPGVEHTHMSQGLNPKPPRLDTEKIQAYSDAELYWIIKHGIKMTGMPGFGPTHDDQQLWAMVAFLRRLPALTPEDYTAMVKAAGLEEGAGAQSHHGENDPPQSATQKAGKGGHH
jgi:mono/diheme cytochrome c family protein